MTDLERVKAQAEKLTEAVWERLAADVANGKGMLKTSVHEALVGALVAEKPAKLIGDGEQWCEQIPDYLAGQAVPEYEYTWREYSLPMPPSKPEEWKPVVIDQEAYEAWTRKMNDCGWRI